MSDKQVKSKARVAKHGEVFTNPREVNAMLDLVQDQITRMDATFLEPACGSGNFLVEILRRRMAHLNQKYKSSLHFSHSDRKSQRAGCFFPFQKQPAPFSEHIIRLVGHTPL